MAADNPYLFQSIHVATKFPLRQVNALFEEQRITLDSTRAAFKDNDGYFFVFNFGAVCFFNLPKERQQAITKQLKATFPFHHREQESDDFELEVKENTPLHVGFDRVTLPRFSFESVDLMAMILAESVSLDYFDNLVEELLQKGSKTAEQLSTKGRILGSMRTINRFLGLAMRTRQDIVINLYLLDKPEVVWEDEELEKFYHALFRMFELRERFVAIEFKLKTLQENMALLGSLANNKKTEHLEIAIVILILIEVLLFAYELFLSN